MATKPKASISDIRKEKKAPSPNSPITTSTNKRILKPSTTKSPTNKATSTPLQKTSPNHPKPTSTSPLQSSQSLKLAKNDGPTKAGVDRRRSLDTRQTHSVVTKQKELSHSRQLKALVSPGARDRSQPIKTSGIQSKSTHNPLKPGSERIMSKTLKEGRSQPLPKSSKKGNISTSTIKKVASNTMKQGIGKTKEVLLNVEAEKQEADEVEKVTESEHEYEHEHEHEHEVDDHDDHQIEESDQPLIQPHVDVIFPTEEAETIEEPQEVKIEDDDHEEDENANQGQCNIYESTHLETNHSTHEDEEVEIKEKEDGVMIEEDYKSEMNNKEEDTGEELNEGEKSGVELIQVQEEHEHEHVERQVEEAKEKSTTSIKEEATCVVQEESEKESIVAIKPEVDSVVHVQGKKESLSNDMIEETASKLLEARKNRVRALAGAFQTVIDHQTK